MEGQEEEHADGGSGSSKDGVTNKEDKKEEGEDNV